MVIKSGNIFNTTSQTIVNTVNCVGVMGAGIALEFKLRHPQLYKKYLDLCKANKVDIGKLWIYNLNDNEINSVTHYKKVLNFPTKLHWKDPSKIEYLRLGLEKFVSTYKKTNITSIAFPLLGASNGKLSEYDSLNIIQEYLSNCNDINIEIWKFDASEYDNLFNKFKKIMNEYNEESIISSTGLTLNKIDKIKYLIDNNKINKLISLKNIEGIGERTLSKIYQFVINEKTNQQEKLKLFS